MRQTDLLARYRCWLVRLAAAISIFATGAALLGDDLLGAVSAALLWFFAGLAANEYDTSPRRGRRLLFRVVAVVMAVLALSRILFTLGQPT